MATLAEVLRGGNCRLVTRLDSDQIQLLWETDYWDGPLSGILCCMGQKYWFQKCEEGHDVKGFYRRYAIVELTSEQLGEEEYWHDLFVENVGMNCDYIEGLRKSDAQLNPVETWQNFYLPHSKRMKPDYSGNHVIGWFELQLPLSS